MLAAIFQKIASEAIPGSDGCKFSYGEDAVIDYAAYELGYTCLVFCKNNSGKKVYPYYLVDFDARRAKKAAFMPHCWKLLHEKSALEKLEK